MTDLCKAECHAQWSEKPYVCDMPWGHSGTVHEQGSSITFKTYPDGTGWVHIRTSNIGIAKIEVP